MTARKANVLRHMPSKVRLSADALAKLRGLVAEHGYEGAGKIAGASEQTIEELASGGFAMRRTVARIEEALLP